MSALLSHVLEGHRDEQAPAYRAALEAIQSRGRFGVRLGLGRTRALLHAVGNPHLALRGPLIGGTNGKGSVQALVSAVLREAGMRVGQTPKPHLVSYRERIVVDGAPIAPLDLAAVLSDVLRHADAVARRHGEPTEFEVLTVAAFSWFARAPVDVAVVEVGLGGRLDATNAWDGGVAAITNVDLDHMDRLGSTVTAIAREKAAILKPGDRAVTGATGEGLAPIRRRARAVGVELREVAPLPVLSMDRAGLTVLHAEHGEVRLGLLGRHQALNAAVAVAVLEELDGAGIAPLDVSALVRGLAAARWPGRLELLAIERDHERGSSRAVPADGRAPRPGAPDLLLDGAHNAAGMRSLREALGELRPLLSAGRVTLLTAASADKDVPAMLAELAASPAIAEARIIATTMSSPRTMAAADLGDAWRHTLERAGPAAGTADIRADDDWISALDDAVGAARAEDGPLVVAGSLYLVGDVRGRLVRT